MPTKPMQLFRFNGGVKPTTHKAESATAPIAKAPLPSYLAIPLHQSIGGLPQPLVGVGEYVKKGQLIGAADGWISASVHASTSGQVVNIAPHPFPHPSGLSADCVWIEPDGKDEWIDLNPPDLDQLDRQRLYDHLREAGIVGLGGAVFPSHAKLTLKDHQRIDTLIINGAECEPFITCDDRLMRERAADIVAGIELIVRLLSPRQVLIGIEDNKPEAILALRKAVAKAAAAMEVISVPTLYPAGGAKQLIRVLTGKEIPASKRSPDMGVQCFNVATAYSAYLALRFGEPLISRVVTLAGAVAEPRNYEVLIGTPINELMALARPKRQSAQIIMGGPMMGFVIPDSRAPIVKASNCLIAHSDELFPPAPAEMPCIRCGECATACPHELLPFELYWYARAKQFDRVEAYHIDDCIECGCCSYVCPSHIPLVHYFRYAKGEIGEKKHAQREAERAKTRFEFRQFRDERDKLEKAERIARAAEQQAAKLKAASSSAATEPQAPDSATSDNPMVAAAIARAQERRSKATPSESD